MKKKQLLLLLALAVPAVGRAESQKEIYRDLGLYTAMGPMNVITFSAFNNQFLTELTNQSDAAEGNKYFRMTAQGGSGNWGGYGIFNVTTPGGTTIANRNFSDYFTPNPGAFRFWVRSNNRLVVEIQGASDTGFSPKYSRDIASTGGVWQEFVFPFTFGVPGGIDVNNVQSPFIIRKHDDDANLTLTWDVDHVRWTKPVNAMQIFPSSVKVNPGRRRQFTIESTAANGEPITINATFTPTTGSMTPGGAAVGRSSVLTSGFSVGNHQVTARSNFDNKQITASVQVTNEDLDATLGLLSETISGVVLGTDSSLQVASGGGAAGATTVDETHSDVREGTKRFSTIVNSPSGGFTGWYIQHGLGGSPDSATRDMSNYYDGSIRFWFKAPAALQGILEVGIRSGNVPGGTELSKVVLNASHGAIFDNQWRPVVIPLSQLAKAPPYADLSRTKVLFSVFAVGNTSGPQTFYIDKLRWDTRTPSALSTLAITPNSVTIPVNLKRNFSVRGFDSAGVQVDVWPTWDFQGAAVGTLSRSQGDSVILTAQSTPASGILRVTDGTRQATADVTVSNVVFTQFFNVYSDSGAGGEVGIDKNPNSAFSLANPEPTPPDAPEGVRVMRANYTLTNQSGLNDAYGVWFVYEFNGTRYLQTFEQGYMHFWIRTTRDVEISVRSENIPAGGNLAKYRLSELGVPTNGTWQEVWLSLNDFKLKDPRLDFAQMKVFFAAAVLSAQIGTGGPFVFDVDEVKWYTSTPGGADVNKVYNGLKAKQHPSSGLVLTFDNDLDLRAVTYDQALVAMAYTYHNDTALAAKILDVYKTKYNNGVGFAGFHEEFQWDNPSVIRDFDRTAGPNAFLMLAAIHYKAVTGSNTYDAMITGMANWIRSLQDPADNAIKFGFLGAGGTAVSNKSTEHNFDVVAAFRAYAALFNNPTFTTEANEVQTWLTTSHLSGGAFNVAQGRFNVGKDVNGVANTDFALDCYSWAPLALPGFDSFAGLAEAAFGTTKVNDTTGLSITGFDFSGLPGNPPGRPYGLAVDKDAVWIEGTGHMVVAYQAVGNLSKADFYLNQLEKTIFTTGPNTQSMAYATNMGTAYGFNMDSTHGSISSMAWYVFGKRGFNPLQPVPLWDVQVKNISNNAVAAAVNWTANVPTRWVRANQYIQIRTQAANLNPWGVQIYTDNKNTAFTPRFVDPTPTVPNDPASNPGGLLKNSGPATTSETLPMAWRIMDSTTTPPAAVRPFNLAEGDGGNPQAYNWFYFKDKQTPAIDANGDGDTSDTLDSGVFIPGEDYVIVKTNAGIHNAQGPAGYLPNSLSPDFIYLEADFGTASFGTTYTTNIILEYFFQ